MTMVPPPCNRVAHFFDWLREIVVEFVWLIDAIHGNIKKVDDFVISDRFDRGG